MVVSYQHARRFLGQSVCVHCVNGHRYYGIVQQVTPDGIWMDIPTRAGLAGGNSEQANAITADKPEVVKGETVQFFFSRFFFPFFFLLALSPFFFW